MIRVEHEPGGWRIYLTNHDVARKSVIKTIPGRTFDWQERCWHVPEDGTKRLKREFGAELFAGSPLVNRALIPPPSAKQQTEGGTVHPSNAIRVQSYYSENKSPSGALLCISGDIRDSLIAR